MALNSEIHVEYAVPFFDQPILKPLMVSLGVIPRVVGADDREIEVAFHPA